MLMFAKDQLGVKNVFVNAKNICFVCIFSNHEQIAFKV